MDEEDNPESPEQDIEFLEDDFVEVVDLDDEGEAAEGTKHSYPSLARGGLIKLS